MGVILKIGEGLKRVFFCFVKISRDVISPGHPGVRFDQAYDLKTLKPVPAWQQMYEEVKAEVRDLGLITL